MAYTTIGKVRNLFGFSEKDASDEAITEFIAYVDSEVEDITKKEWSGSEEHYGKVEEAATIFVGSLVYKRFRDKQQLSKQLWDEGEKKLRDLGRTPYTKATSYEVVEET